MPAFYPGNRSARKHQPGRFTAAPTYVWGFPESPRFGDYSALSVRRPTCYVSQVEASLLSLRNTLGNWTGYGQRTEPVLYRSIRGVGAAWPCGCIACGQGFEWLEMRLCSGHRTCADGAAAVRVNRRKSVDRRRPF
jgi:hypothetical protein